MNVFENSDIRIEMLVSHVLWTDYEAGELYQYGIGHIINIWALESISALHLDLSLYNIISYSQAQN